MSGNHSILLNISMSDESEINGFKKKNILILSCKDKKNYAFSSLLSNEEKQKHQRWCKFFEILSEVFRAYFTHGIYYPKLKKKWNLSIHAYNNTLNFVNFLAAGKSN